MKTPLRTWSRVKWHMDIMGRNMRNPKLQLNPIILIINHKWSQWVRDVFNRSRLLNTPMLYPRHRSCFLLYLLLQSSFFIYHLHPHTSLYPPRAFLKLILKFNLYIKYTVHFVTETASWSSQFVTISMNWLFLIIATFSSMWSTTN